MDLVYPHNFMDSSLQYLQCTPFGDIYINQAITIIACKKVVRIKLLIDDMTTIVLIDDHHSIDR